MYHNKNSDHLKLSPFVRALEIIWKPMTASLTHIKVTSQRLCLKEKLLSYAYFDMIYTVNVSVCNYKVGDRGRKLRN